MENFNLNNCYIKAFNASYDRISYETWDEFYTAVKGTKVTRIDLCCREGYIWQKTADDGTFIYHSWSGDEVVNISDGNDIVSTKYNPMKNEPIDDTTVRLSTSSADMLQYITGITATPLSLAPPKPDKPYPLKTYPDEILENVYIDDWAIVLDVTVEPPVRKKVVRDYSTVKDFLDKSSGRTKKAITLQAQKGFNFSLSDDDGSITFYNGETYTFKYMYDHGIPVGDEPPYNEPDSYRDKTYPDARKFIFLKGEEYIDGIDEYIVIRSYDHETIDIDLMSHGQDYRLIKMLSETSTDSPPFSGIDENRIGEINCHALIPVEIPLKNDAFSTYILSGEQMNNLRDNMVIYNDMVINTYNYPIPFNPDSLLDTEMKIGTADTNIPVKEFKQIKNEIQIFEFTIPELPDVNLVTLFPIFKEGITLTYDIIRGKVIKGISVYDCLSNTNYLKIYADDVLIDYVSYNIQTQIPINWDNVKFENKGSIGQRIPYFKSYIIIQYDKLEQVTEVTKGYIRGSVENLDSLILKDEISIMDSLFKGGVYYDDSKKVN